MAGRTKIWEWPGSQITNVVDGDTVDARMSRDIGFHGEVVFVQRLRLNRIDAFKATTELGKLGKEDLWQITTRQVLYITTLKPYKYGDEWMAEIVLPDGSNVNDWMVTRQLAKYWDGVGPRPAGASYV